MKENIIETYLNYLYAVRMHEEYGDFMVIQMTLLSIMKIK